ILQLPPQSTLLPYTTLFRSFHPRLTQALYGRLIGFTSSCHNQNLRLQGYHLFFVEFQSIVYFLEGPLLEFLFHPSSKNLISTTHAYQGIPGFESINGANMGTRRHSHRSNRNRDNLIFPEALGSCFPPPDQCKLNSVVKDRIPGKNT